ncbi:MAG: AAA family ATPase [Microbacter sp.]
MKNTTHLVITISRQLGSGGAYIGQALSQKLNLYYADNEIIQKVAEKYSLTEEYLAHRDERIESIWKSFLKFSAFSSEKFIPTDKVEPTSEELFNAETTVIQHVAKEHPSVIIGRCGFHVLREMPNRISIYLHSDLLSRQQRIQEVYGVSADQAREMILQSDKERGQYIQTFTGKKWTDARNYHLTIDTGALGFDRSIELILQYIRLKTNANPASKKD